MTLTDNLIFAALMLITLIATTITWILRRRRNRVPPSVFDFRADNEAERLLLPGFIVSLKGSGPDTMRMIMTDYDAHERAPAKGDIVVIGWKDDRARKAKVLCVEPLGGSGLKHDSFGLSRDLVFELKILGPVSEDDMLDEYDFSGGVRGKYVGRTG